MSAYSKIILLCLLFPHYIPAVIPTLSNSWAQMTLNQLTFEEKIGQLFMVAAVSDEADNPEFIEHAPYQMERSHVEQLIKNYHVGGIIFLGYGISAKQHTVTEHFQQFNKKFSKIPLLIGQDLEWGLQMRLHDTVKFPYAMTLGALQDDKLVYKIAKEIGRQCHALGVHINFAPVVDINTNPNNPVINYRSFGEDKENVTQKALAFTRGLQDTGVLSCAKHFPGHGDTATDSHYDLPLLELTTERLHDIELYPYKQLIVDNVPAIMVAHLAIPALESNPQCPATLSHNIVTTLLRRKLGFGGLIVTDGLGMQGVTNHYKPGNLELNALLAGNDILLCPLDVPKAVALIKQAIADNKITVADIDRRVLRILRAKEWALQQQSATYEELQMLLHSEKAYKLKRKAYRDAITLVHNQNNIIPLQTDQSVTVVQIGSEKEETFAQKLNESFIVSTHCIPTDADAETINTLMQTISTDIPVIVSLHNMSKYARDNYGITSATQKIISQIHNRNKSAITVVFGNPYSLGLLEATPGLICGYEDDPEAQIAAAQVIAGTIEAKGKLPVSTI